jgi:hypothetical protein
MFINIVLLAWAARVNPVSTIANPVIINTTKNPQMSVQVKLTGALGSFFRVAAPEGSFAIAIEVNKARSKKLTTKHKAVFDAKCLLMIVNTIISFTFGFWSGRFSSKATTTFVVMFM